MARANLCLEDIVVKWIPAVCCTCVLSAAVPAVLCSLVELDLRKGFVGRTAQESLHWKHEKMVSVP